MEGRQGWRGGRGECDDDDGLFKTNCKSIQGMQAEQAQSPWPASEFQSHELLKLDRAEQKNIFPLNSLLATKTCRGSLAKFPSESAPPFGRFLLRPSTSTVCLPSKIDFSSHPSRPSYPAPTFLKGLVIWTHSKGCFHATKNFLFCFTTTPTGQGRQAEGGDRWSECRRIGPLGSVVV